MIDKHTVLVANRGEIALRVIRSARALGLRTVAVYSDADADAPHVRAADEAFRLGPAPVGESYLSVERLLAACEATGAGLVHPGYGFLSERASFARAVEGSGRVFVGPPADAIDAMGDKARAKAAMRAADVPTVPGFDGDDPSDAALLEAAASVGFPLLVKASAGGGGRGMRVVRQAAELPAALASARREAEGAFGSGALLLERLIERGRHVEVQVMADRHGTVLHLGERDCSVQRRHQKVIEEAPSPAVSPALRAEMGAAAVRAAAAVGYVGAGTVEFLLDDDGSFYFLEMNTRLQVEHPVTELVTGLDLVDLQLRVALGQPLGLAQDDIVLRGHAIEARLYAEEPAAGYAPRTGTLTAFSVPEGPGLRCDAGVAAGGTVSAFYDPMLAKLMAAGPDRETARRRLLRMLEDTVAAGVVTNRAFLGRVLAHPVFAEGEATTRFLDGAPDLAEEPDAPEDARRVAIAAHLARTARPAFRSSHPVPQRVVLDVDGDEVPVALGAGRVLDVDGAAVALSLGPDGRGSLTLGPRRVPVQVLAEGPATRVQFRGHVVRVGPWDPSPAPAESDGGDGVVRAASAGTVVALPVAPGDRVAPDTVVAVVEAMKLETALRAGVAGVVAEVRGAPGASVAAGDTLVLITPDPTEGDTPSEEIP
jgi:geranyl-CoA carboxylase alpha subunit